MFLSSVIRKLYPEITTLIVSHRVKGLSNWVSILVWDNGMVVIEGDYRYLKKNCQLFDEFLFKDL